MVHRGSSIIYMDLELIRHLILYNILQLGSVKLDSDADCDPCSFPQLLHSMARDTLHREKSLRKDKVCMSLGVINVKCPSQIVPSTRVLKLHKTRRVHWCSGARYKLANRFMSAVYVYL